MPLKHSKPTLAQCKATSASGDRCKAKPHRDDLCFFHSDPKKAAELGRKGGRANRHNYETQQEVVPPETVGDVKRMLAQTMAKVLAGQIAPKLGTTIAYMGIALLRAYEAEPPVPPGALLLNSSDDVCRELASRSKIKNRCGQSYPQTSCSCSTVHNSLG